MSTKWLFTFQDFKFPLLPLLTHSALWDNIYFGRNIGMWGVQSVTMERPAHTVLFQPIWNHPPGENGQKRKFGSLKGGLAYFASAFAIAIFCCSYNLCAGEPPHSASSHFNMLKA